MKLLLLAFALHGSPDPDSAKVRDVANLGMIWGFLKYHHPAVTSGRLDWDAELIRILPSVLGAHPADSVLEAWVDALGRPAPCSACATPSKFKVRLEPDYAWFARLPESLRMKLAYIRDNRSQGKQHYVEQYKAWNVSYSNERGYPDMHTPDTGYRLLALFRFWNIIQYFYPYRYGIDDWNTTLSQMIPIFLGAGDSTSYALACVKLIALIADTHAGIYNNPALVAHWGSHRAPIQTVFVGDTLVVLDTSGTFVQRGDIITSIGDVPVQTRLAQDLPYVGGSNMEARKRQLTNSFLLRSRVDSLDLDILRDGVPLHIKVPCGDRVRTLPQVAIITPLEGEIAYLHSGWIQEKDMPDLEKALDSTKGLIIDMRTVAFDEQAIRTMTDFLKDVSSPATLLSVPDLDCPGRMVMLPAATNGGEGKRHYDRPVAVLVNTYTQSSGEYDVMFFQSAPHVKVLGSTTAGADGNVSYVTLPGNLVTAISGIGVYYPDGGETQRLGLRIDVPVTITFSGIKHKRDETLEAALTLIRGEISGKSPADL